MEANQLREGILTTRYRGNISIISVKLIGAAEKKMATGRRAHGILQNRLPRNRQIFRKNGRWGKNQEINRKRHPPDDRRSPRKLCNRMQWRWNRLFKKLRLWIGKKNFVRNQVGIWCELSASKTMNVWNATQKLTQNVQYYLSSDSLYFCFAIDWFCGHLLFWLRFLLAVLLSFLAFQILFA